MDSVHTYMHRHTEFNIFPPPVPRASLTGTVAAAEQELEMEQVTDKVVLKSSQVLFQPE